MANFVGRLTHACPDNNGTDTQRDVSGEDGVQVKNRETDGVPEPTRSERKQSFTGLTDSVPQLLTEQTDEAISENTENYQSHPTDHQRWTQMK